MTAHLSRTEKKCVYEGCVWECFLHLHVILLNLTGHHQSVPWPVLDVLPRKSCQLSVGGRLLL